MRLGIKNKPSPLEQRAWRSLESICRTLGSELSNRRKSAENAQFTGDWKDYPGPYKKFKDAPHVYDPTRGIK